MDDLSKAASKAAIRATSMSTNLHLGASSLIPRDDKRACLVKAFRDFRAFCRHMKTLEAIAPNCAAEGYEEDERSLDVIEVVQARASA